MPLKFCNKYSSPVSVCVSWYTPNCPDGGDWSKAGWWNLAPEETKSALGHNLNNRWHYFFAFAQDGSTWSGDFNVMVPWRAFNWCDNVSSTDARRVGMREVDTGEFKTFTINLTP